MSERDAALAAARDHYDSGVFVRDLARRVAIRSESQDPAQAAALQAYLADEMQPSLAALGFEVSLHPNPLSGTGCGPFLIARRVEDAAVPTVLMYGHGDVIRGQDASWTKGQGPWQLTADGDRLYGRGSADNKGQHSINIAALAQVLAVRGGRLGFNATWLIETGEETGSPGLAEFCTLQRDALRADVLIASDGPRLRADLPTLFLGTRGVANFDLQLKLRDGAHHSGNWGGLLRNPGTVLANAIASLVDGRGRILVDALRPPPIPPAVRAALHGLHVGGGPGDPAIDTEWGEADQTPIERVLAWNALEVLAMRTGNPDFPINAVPAHAQAHLQLRFVVGTPIAQLRAGRAAASGRTRLRRHRGRRAGGDAGDPARPRQPVGALGAGVDRTQRRRAAGTAAEPGRLAAERRLRRHPRPADGVGAAQLPGLFAARAERTPAGPGGAPGTAADDRPVLGPGRRCGDPAATRAGRGVTASYPAARAASCAAASAASRWRAAITAGRALKAAT